MKNHNGWRGEICPVNVMYVGWRDVKEVKVVVVLYATSLG